MDLNKSVKKKPKTTTLGGNWQPNSEGAQMKDDDRKADDLKEAARHLKSDARDAAAAVKDDLEDVARRAGTHAREFADSAEHGLKDAGGAVAAKIRENPVQSSLIALGLGLVAGLLYRR